MQTKAPGFLIIAGATVWAVTTTLAEFGYETIRASMAVDAVQYAGLAVILAGCVWAAFALDTAFAKAALIFAGVSVATLGAFRLLWALPPQWTINWGDRLAGPLAWVLLAIAVRWSAVYPRRWRFVPVVLAIVTLLHLIIPPVTWSADSSGLSYMYAVAAFGWVLLGVAVTRFKPAH